jgi:hypothetical protein
MDELIFIQYVLPWIIAGVKTTVLLLVGWSLSFVTPLCWVIVAVPLGAWFGQDLLKSIGWDLHMMATRRYVGGELIPYCQASDDDRSRLMWASMGLAAGAGFAYLAAARWGASGVIGVGALEAISTSAYVVAGDRIKELKEQRWRS